MHTAFSVWGVGGAGWVGACATTAACAWCCPRHLCFPCQSGCFWVHLVSGVGAHNAGTRALLCVRPPCSRGAVNGGPSPGARLTVAVVIQVTAVGASEPGNDDLSPLVATP